MSEMSPATALRQIQQAHAGLRKARQALVAIRQSGDDADLRHRVLRAGWDGLTKAFRILAEIPLAAANEAVMTKQLSTQRYATALLVRLRRLARNDPGALEGLDGDDDDEEA